MNAALKIRQDGGHVQKLERTLTKLAERFHELGELQEQVYRLANECRIAQKLPDDSPETEWAHDVHEAGVWQRLRIAEQYFAILKRLGSECYRERKQNGQVG